MIDFELKLPPETKDEFGFTPSENRQIEKQLTRPKPPKGLWKNWVKASEKTDNKEEALAQALIESNKLAEKETPKQTWERLDSNEKKRQKKHLKDLIVFGLENSSEPVIKNPVMRKALEDKPKKSVNYLSDNYSFEENFKKQSKNINKKKYPTEASPEQFANLAYNLEKNKQMQGAATNLKEFGHRFNENKKEPLYPKIVVPRVNLNLIKREPPEPEIPIDQRIKDMADQRLKNEQRAWDYKNGRGGIAERFRPD